MRCRLDRVLPEKVALDGFIYLTNPSKKGIMGVIGGKPMTDKTNLNKPQFQNAEKARQYLESLRWPNGPVCPHCGSVSKNHYALEGEAHRAGLWKCRDCREQFTVTVGTVFERS